MTPLKIRNSTLKLYVSNGILLVTSVFAFCPHVNTYGRSHVNMTDGEIAKKIAEMFDLRPKAIERQLKLRQPMFQETAAYGHMGRKNEIVEKTFTSRYHEAKTVKVELFTWEKLDKVDEIKKVFGL